MKKTLQPFILFAVCGSLAAFSNLSARAQDTGFYLKADVGGQITQDLDLKEFFGVPLTPGSKVKLDPGARVGIAGGYQLTDWFAAEAEVGFLGNEIDSITSATRIHDASFANVPFLLNAKLQYPNRSRVTPYAGAGAGFSESIIDVGRITIMDANGGETSMRGNDTDTVFAWQAFGGLRFKLNEQMNLGLEYRYFSAESAKWRADFSSGTPSDTMSFGRARTHSVSLTFEFRF